MNKRSRYFILMTALALMNLLTVVDGKDENPSIDEAADILAQTFLQQISDVPKMCQQMELSQIELHNVIKAEFIKLAHSEQKAYRIYVTKDTSREKERHNILLFFEEFAKQSTSLDYISSFLAWTLYYPRRMDAFFDNQETIVSEDRIELDNLCMNALSELSTGSGLPPIFLKIKTWLSDDFWEMQGWHNAYCVATSMYDRDVAWWWVNATIFLLRDVVVAEDSMPDSVLTELSELYCQKFNDDNDQYSQFYRAQLVTQNQSHLDLLDTSFKTVIEHKYPGLDWKSPSSFGIYWSEYGLRYHSNQAQLQKMLERSIFENCARGRVFVVKDNGIVLFVVRCPNFNMYDELYNIWHNKLKVAENADSRMQKGARIGIKKITEQCLYNCLEFDQDICGDKLYKQFSNDCPEEVRASISFQDYAQQLLQKRLEQMPHEGIEPEVYSSLKYGFTLIAVGDIKDGNALLQYAERICELVNELDAFSEGDKAKLKAFQSIRNSVLQSVVSSLPKDYAMQLKNWNQGNL